MGTGIYKNNVFGEREEVPQEHIDAWCDLCQFPTFTATETGKTYKCTEPWQIQRCWDGTNAIAGEWHKQHECPFIHQNQICRCNDYKDIKEAFVAAYIDRQ